MRLAGDTARLAVIGLAGLALIGCGMDATSPISGTRVTLTLGVSATSTAVGDPDTITVRLTNTASDSVTLHFGTGCQVLLYIANAQGEIVYPAGGAWMCTMELTTRSLAPHATDAHRFVWTGRTRSASLQPLRPLPPGSYDIYATLGGPVDPWFTTPRVRVELR